MVKAKKKTKKVLPKKRAVNTDCKAKKVGRVTHYFDNIGVAVIKLSAPLKKGDSICIEGGGACVSQKVVSMENDHKKVAAAKKGAEIGMKVKKKAREGYRVFKK